MSFASTVSPAAAPTTYRPTREIIREKIAAWLRDEAGLPADSIDDSAPLSHLGIDSLGIATISCELERATGKRLNLDVLFELENINQIARYMDQMAVTVMPMSRPDAGLDGGNGSVYVETSAIPPSLAPSLLQHYELLNRRVRTLQEH